jgi:tetratricopeptide (TPR) repeat protein
MAANTLGLQSPRRRSFLHLETVHGARAGPEYLKRGDSYRILGELKKAEEDFNAVLAIDPNSDKARSALQLLQYYTPSPPPPPPRALPPAMPGVRPPQPAPRHRPGPGNSLPGGSTGPGGGITGYGGSAAGSGTTFIYRP